MSALLAVQAVDLSSSNTTLVIVVGVIAIFAVAIAMVFRSQVLAANDGTENMKAIAVAVQEGAAAYLSRQFKTLSVFAVALFTCISRNLQSVNALSMLMSDMMCCPDSWLSFNKLRHKPRACRQLSQ